MIKPWLIYDDHKLKNLKLSIDWSILWNNSLWICFVFWYNLLTSLSCDQSYSNSIFKISIWLQGDYFLIYQCTALNCSMLSFLLFNWNQTEIAKNLIFKRIESIVRVFDNDMFVNYCSNQCREREIVALHILSW
jgi:hypothetical protein